MTARCPFALLLLWRLCGLTTSTYLIVAFDSAWLVAFGWVALVTIALALAVEVAGQCAPP